MHIRWSVIGCGWGIGGVASALLTIRRSSCGRTYKSPLLKPTVSRNRKQRGDIAKPSLYNYTVQGLHFFPAQQLTIGIVN